MGKPNSLGLRERIVAYIEAGHSARSAARAFSAAHGVGVPRSKCMCLTFDIVFKINICRRRLDHPRRSPHTNRPRA